MTRQQRKTIEREFYNYKINKNRLGDYAVSVVAYQTKPSYSGDKVTTSKGNSVEQLMLRAIFDEERMRLWCMVFEKTLEKYKWELKDKLMVKKYIEHKGIYRICDEIGISRATYFYWLEQLLETAFMWAKEYRLF